MLAEEPTSAVTVSECINVVAIKSVAPAALSIPSARLSSTLANILSSQVYAFTVVTTLI